MTAIRPRALDHTSIRIGDLARSRAFYEELLGLSPAPRPDLGLPGAWYDIGGAQLHLIEQQQPLGDIDPTGPHFALRVDDVDAVRRELDARGVPYRDFGGTQLWVRDPDGNVVEICGPR